MHTYIVSHDPIDPGPRPDGITATLGAYLSSVPALTSTRATRGSGAGMHED